MAALAFGMNNCQQLYEVAQNLISQDEERAKIAKYLRASPFTDYLSNEFIFRQIHLAGQYL
jgi:hypothetical protein